MLACEADARGRKGFEDQPYEPGERLRAALAAAPRDVPVLRARLESELRRRGDTVEVLVSTTDTDPWTFRV